MELYKAENLTKTYGNLLVLQAVHRDLGKTIIMVTHDSQMAEYCDRVVWMKDGTILE